MRDTPVPPVRRVVRATLALAALAFGALDAAPAVAQSPTLVVLVTVDQLRADYLDRFAAQLDGGLARLVRDGARFTNAVHDHAIPETAPGHATLLSGRFPRSTGILTNAGAVSDTTPLLGEPGGRGASPRRFRGTTLVDWLRARDPRIRALSVSGKDRSAILPIGAGREHVYWYEPSGRFTTSTYYRDTLPDWVAAFNRRDLARRRAGQAWTLLLPEGAYPEPDSVSIEGAGRDVAFPHALPADSADAAAWIAATPWIDELTLALALDGVRALDLGAGPHTDLLSVSLSATDAIGHVYGPDSREIHDQVLRLDRALGAFLDTLLALRDPARVLVVLAADHGVASIPELVGDAVQPRAMRADLGPLVEATRARLRAAGADTLAIDAGGGLVFADRAALERARLRPDSVLDAFAAEARVSGGILRVDRFRDLLKADPARDSVARRWAHQLPAGANVELVATLAPGSVWWGTNVAAHQSPWTYDVRVPLVFWGAAFRAGRIDAPVRTVDLAPTLAAALGLRPPPDVDGVVLRAALR